MKTRFSLVTFTTLALALSLLLAACAGPSAAAPTAVVATPASSAGGAGNSAQATTAPTLAPPATAAPATAAPTTAPTKAAAASSSGGDNDDDYGYGSDSGSSQAAGQAASLAVGQTAELGQFLTDAAGRSLYVFLKDTPPTSACYDSCAENWPPLLTTAAPAGTADLHASELGTTQRTDGALQVTYHGHPLYHFAGDKASGDVNGQGVGKVWFVISPAGEVVGAP